MAEGEPRSGKTLVQPTGCKSKTCGRGWPLKRGDFEMVGPAGIDAAVALRDGIMRFALYGTKLRGQWTVLKTRMGKGTRENWLLQKVDDEFAEADYNPETEPASALSGKVPRGRP